MTALGARPTSGLISKLTPLQRAAIVMMVVGEETAARILSTLAPDEVHRLGEAMYSVQGAGHEVVNAVLDDFLLSVGGESGLAIGRGAYVRRVLDSAFGTEKAKSVFSRIVPAQSARAIDILDWMEPDDIVELIVVEHPQIAALALAALEHSRAASVLMLLEPDLQVDLIQRIATLQTVPPEALHDLEHVMQTKFMASNSLRSTQFGGVKAAARIINFTQQATEEHILKRIKKDDKVLSQDLEENLFVFEYLVKSDDREIQKVLREIEPATLALALKGTTPDLSEKLLRCVSARAGEIVKDEIEAIGPVRLSAVLRAQREIISVARRLADSGAIMLAGRGGDTVI
ncbi:MAG: flagellar motor switch protein FliG [Pseudomonadota bacterium]